jgi:hypothetical protein
MHPMTAVKTATRGNRDNTIVPLGIGPCNWRKPTLSAQPVWHAVSASACETISNSYELVFDSCMT